MTQLAEKHISSLPRAQAVQSKYSTNLAQRFQRTSTVRISHKHQIVTCLCASRASAMLPCEVSRQAF